MRANGLALAGSFLFSAPASAAGAALAAKPRLAGGAAGIPTACITGKGALVTGSAAGTPVALPPAGSGYVLKTNTSCPEGLEWDYVGATCSALRDNCEVFSTGSFQLRASCDTRNFQIRSSILVPTRTCVTWTNSGCSSCISFASFMGYCPVFLCQNKTLTSTWVELAPSYSFAAHGNVQTAMICINDPGNFQAAWCFVGIIGSGYNNNILCVTRLY